MKLLRLGQAAEYLGVHPVTLRRWTNEGKIPCERVGISQTGKPRRYRQEDLDVFLGRSPHEPPRCEALYVRVSGATGQDTSLENQEQELRDTSTGEIIKVYRDKASGLNPDRPGLQRLLRDASTGQFNIVRVTHEDRLARFGAPWIQQLLAKDNVQLEILHKATDPDAKQELVQDLISIIASFSGRLYGIRSAENRKRLLEQLR